jgi:epoxyqueuosine reductase
MSFMESHFDKRLNLTLLVEDAKSVVFAVELLSWAKQNDDSYKISKYAYGADYHYVIKDKLKELLFSIQETSEVSGRAFVDSVRF